MASIPPDRLALACLSTTALLRSTRCLATSLMPLSTRSFLPTTALASISQSMARTS